MSKKNENYSYESKCRRCGHITEFYFAGPDMITHEHFMVAILDYVANPRFRHCESCSKETVQEVVSVSVPQN
jgi:hypothetical protein